MNGVRSIFKRKGYLLTALTAAVLLAASSGTAYAQLTATADYGEGGVKVEVPETVAESNSATITVSASASVALDSTVLQRTVTIAITVDAASTAEAGDYGFNPTTAGAFNLMFPANPTPAVGTGEAVTHIISKTLSLQTIRDADAEDEAIILKVVVTEGLTPTIANQTLTIDDADHR